MTATGDQLLDQACAFISRFAAFPSDAARDAVVLWSAHTHAVKAFGATPRLAVLSDEPRSGKTRVVELAGLLSKDATQEVDLTAPAFAAMMSQRTPTVIIDECDTVWGPHGGASHRALRGMINAGYKQGATVTRRVGGAYVHDQIFGPVALAGIGILPATLMDRSVVVRMERRKAGTELDRYLPRMHGPDGASIGKSLGEWVQSVAIELSAAWPDLPDGIEDRAAEIWEPLLAVADAAGGSWPERARIACRTLALGIPAEPSVSPGERLLGDLRVIWGDAKALPTSEIIRRLFALDGASWSRAWPAEMAARELAGLVAGYGIGPVKIRMGDRTMQGYKRADFETIWAEMPVLDVPDVRDVLDIDEELRSMA